jgi:hypothetical protein
MIRNLRAAQRSSRNLCSTAVDCLTVNKPSSRSRRHGRWIVRVCVVPIHAVEVDVVHVANICVVNIYVAYVRPARTVAIPRVKYFTETQRKPAHSNTYSEASAETPAKESNESRPVNWIVADRSRAPAPPGAKIIPPSVVKRRKSPRRIVHPSPAPRSNVAPISIAVRSPANRHAVGIPNRSVVRLLRPRAVIVEVGIAYCVARHVARRN